MVTSHQLLVNSTTTRGGKNYRNIRIERKRERIESEREKTLAGVKLSIYLKLQSSSSSLFEVVVGSLSRTSLKAISVSLFHPENQMLIVILIRKS